MKVTKWVDMGADVDIEIDSSDIRAAISEAIEGCEPGLFGEPRILEVLNALNAIGAFLWAFDAELIAQLTEAQRNVVARFLKGAAVRFEVTA